MTDPTDSNPHRTDPNPRPTDPMPQRPVMGDHPELEFDEAARTEPVRRRDRFSPLLLGIAALVLLVILIIIVVAVT